MKAKIVNGAVRIIDGDVEYSRLRQEYAQNLLQNNVSNEDLTSIWLKAESQRTVVECSKLKKREEIDAWYAEKLNSLNEFKELEVIPFNGEIEEYERLEPVFEEYENKIVQNYIKVSSRQLLKERISEMKKGLSETDYVIIKTYEAKIMMQDAPYSDDFVTKIVDRRQGVRDEINRLEELLKTAK